MAKKTKRLSIHLTDREQLWAIVYLLVSYFLLPTLLAELNRHLPTPLNKVWLNFLYFSINFVMVSWIFSGFFKRSLIHAGHNMLDFLAAIVLGSAVYGLCSWLISLGLDRFAPDFVNLNDGSISGMASSNFAVMLIGTVFLVPVAEEALHRGLIFGCLYPKSHMVAYLLSTTIFSAVHIVGFVGVYTFPNLCLAFLQYVPAGLCLAWAYRRSGSIYAPMLMHAAINAISIFAQR